MLSIYDNLKQVDASALIEMINELMPSDPSFHEDEYADGYDDGVRDVLQRLSELIADA